MLTHEQVARTAERARCAFEVETPTQRARRIIESVRGRIFRPAVGVRPLCTAPTIDALTAAFKVRDTSLLWPGRDALERANEPMLLMDTLQGEPFLCELERRIWWTPRRGLALRLYGAIWPDDTLALWTVPQPRAPSWPVPTPAELATLHERARAAETHIAAA